MAAWQWPGQSNLNTLEAGFGLLFAMRELAVEEQVGMTTRTKSDEAARPGSSPTEGSKQRGLQTTVGSDSAIDRISAIAALARFLRGLDGSKQAAPEEDHPS
jgi:hypothetical protein